MTIGKIDRRTIKRDFCKRGHDLRLPDVRRKNGECRLCAIVRQRAIDERRRQATAESARCPRCGTDMSNPANVCYRHTKHRIVKLCRPCRVSDARKGGYARQSAGNRPERHLSAAETVAILDRDARREMAPPWERHPAPLTDVVYRRAAP